MNKYERDLLKAYLRSLVARAQGAIWLVAEDRLGDVTTALMYCAEAVENSRKLFRKSKDENNR